MKSFECSDSHCRQAAPEGKNVKEWIISFPWLGPPVWSPRQGEVSGGEVPVLPPGLLLTLNRAEVKQGAELCWAGGAWWSLAMLLIFQAAGCNCKAGFHSAFPAVPAAWSSHLAPPVQFSSVQLVYPDLMASPGLVFNSSRRNFRAANVKFSLEIDCHRPGLEVD